MLTVGQLKRALKDVPDNAKCWAYEGEVSGLVVDGGGISGVIHNDGTVDLKPTKRAPQEPRR
jgi:hypothetical protein